MKTRQLERLHQSEPKLHMKISEFKAGFMMIDLILSLFADDGSAWPEWKQKQSYLSQYKILRDFLARVEDWSDSWGLDFSATKSQIVLFSNKHYPKHPVNHNPITLNTHNLEFVDHYKYLGLTFQSNGKWNYQFDSIIAKAKITANLISRINHRNTPPGPLATASLVKYILIPQMSYALHMWRPTKSNFNVMNQLVASVLRRAAGVHKSASAIRTLWEFGIPTFVTTRSVCLLQSVSRAIRSSLKGNFLPSVFVNDINNTTAAASSSTTTSAVSTAKYCRPLPHELVDLQQQYPLAQSLPLDRKQVKTFKTISTTNIFIQSSTPSAFSLKPSLDPPRYFSIDPKPIVCIRARLRLSSALTPRRKHIYGLIDSDQCCGEKGDTKHVILHCQLYNSARTKCITELSKLYPPGITLTVNLVLGLPPPLPTGIHLTKSSLRRLQDQCLAITGTFINAIDRVAHL